MIRAVCGCLFVLWFGCWRGQQLTILLPFPTDEEDKETEEEAGAVNADGAGEQGLLLVACLCFIPWRGDNSQCYCML